VLDVIDGEGLTFALDVLDRALASVEAA
jgi:hypothetical protein